MNTVCRALLLFFLAVSGSLASSTRSWAGHVFSVMETPAGPRLAVDGAPQNAVAALPDPFVAPADYDGSGCVEAMRDMADAGVRMFSNVWSMRNRPHDWWLGEGRYDWKAFDSMALCLLAGCPDGWIMPRIKIEPPEWWIAKHPEEMSSSKEEVRATSGPWRELYRRMLRDVIEHVESSTYADRVAGWHIGGFHCGEWMDYKRPKSERPPVDGRYSGNPLAPAEATAARREYLRTRARNVADALLDAAGLVKKLTHGKKVVCAFFGYSLCIDHDDFMRVLRSGLVDVFSSPAFYMPGKRGVGDPGVPQAYYTASYALHGRLFLEEADPRTHLAKIAQSASAAALLASRPADMRQSVGVLRRIIGRNLAQGTGLWWFLIAGNDTFRPPEIMATVRTGVDEMRRTMSSSRPRMTDVAVFTSADEYATSRACHSSTLCDHKLKFHTDQLPRAGIAYDSYELSDIADPRVGDYSVYVFPNAFSLNDKEQGAINRLSALGKRMVFIPRATSTDELRNQFAAAGAHVYIDSGDVFFAGRGYIAIHASKAGEKRISLPHQCDVVEIFGAAPSRKGVSSLSEWMDFGETRVYSVTPLAGERRPVPGAAR